MIQTGAQNPSSPPSRALGILFVIIGASSYGLLATIIKLAYAHGSTTAEITMIQFALGALVLSGINFIFGKAGRIAGRDARRLLLAGIPGGILSVAYYYSIKYISASVAVVLLMQSVWMGVVAEAIFKKQLPSLEKLAA
ncbi:MAG: EamA family transporter, partial [Proteobacteria bacterium]